jgi:hypothetical protein
MHCMHYGCVDNSYIVGVMCDEKVMHGSNATVKRISFVSAKK